MKLQIRATEQLVKLDGVICRVWEGVDADGIPYLVYVHRVATADSKGQQRADRALIEMDEPELDYDFSAVIL